MDFPVDQIQNMIYEIRGQRVMLDSDLAKLYGVETKRLNEQVRRNIDRFPKDFMFECNSKELDILRSQIATANNISNWNHKRRSWPMMFTENGVAMLSTVLNSKQAIQVNITIMRTFTKLRSFLAMENSVQDSVDELGQNTHKLFKIVFQRLDNIEEQIAPKLPPNRRKIGLKK